MKKTKHFLLKANTSDEYFDDRAYAFLVSTNADLKKRIGILADGVNELKKKMVNVFTVEAFDSTPEPIKKDFIPEELAAKFDNDLIEVLEITEAQAKAITKKIEDDEDGIRMDTLIMKVNGVMVSWDGFYKHTNILVESGSIEIKDL